MDFFCVQEKMSNLFLKGQCNEIFDIFFYQRTLPGPHMNFYIFMKIFAKKPVFVLSYHVSETVNYFTLKNKNYNNNKITKKVYF